MTPTALQRHWGVDCGNIAGRLHRIMEHHPDKPPQEAIRQLMQLRDPLFKCGVIQQRFADHRAARCNRFRRLHQLLTTHAQNLADVYPRLVAAWHCETVDNTLNAP